MNIQSLTDIQMKAVKSVDTPVIISAGAGSGKTRTLINKISYLVGEIGLDPRRILAITFTNKAANGMKERLLKLTGYPDVYFPWVRTFHSACFQMVKRHYELMGFTKGMPQVASDYQQKKGIHAVSTQYGYGKEEHGKIRNMVSLAKNSGDPNTYLESNYITIEERFNIYDTYLKLLRFQNLIDFDDILLLVYEMFKKEDDLRKEYEGFFQYVLIDEYQDTNDIQNYIVSQLTKGKNLTVVGDDYQSIYGFRGSNPSHFIAFKDTYDESTFIKLEQNFRSSKTIVEAANAVIDKNINKLSKECFSETEGGKITYRKFTYPDDEAAWVAQICKTTHDNDGIPYSKMAVLYRTKFVSRVFEKAMREATIPYELIGGVGFMERREILDVLSYLGSVRNEMDDYSFERAMGAPKRGVGAKTLERIRKLGRDLSLQQCVRKAMEDGVVIKKASKPFKELETLLDTLDNMKAIQNPADMILYFFKNSNYIEHLKEFSKDDGEYIARCENIKELALMGSKFASIEDFLDEVSLYRNDQDDQEGDKKDKGVKLCTIHAAKGLEWDMTFIVACEEGILPHEKCIGLATSTTEDGEKFDPGLEEERRLMYVAMTRAAFKLYISSVFMRMNKPCKPSFFLKDIPAKFIDGTLTGI